MTSDVFNLETIKQQLNLAVVKCRRIALVWTICCPVALVICLYYLLYGQMNALGLAVTAALMGASSLWYFLTSARKALKTLDIVTPVVAGVAVIACGFALLSHRFDLAIVYALVLAALLISRGGIADAAHRMKDFEWRTGS